MFYNVNTAKSIVNFFNICLFTGNTCIYSFLPVFLRHLGLSPFQVGILRGLQSLVALACIPIVVLCGRKCLQRRPPMMSCLFLTMAAFLSLLVISLPAPSCFHKDFPVCENFTGHRVKSNKMVPITTELVTRHISRRSSNYSKDGTISKQATEPLTTNKITTEPLVTNSDFIMTESPVMHGDNFQDFSSHMTTNVYQTSQKEQLLHPTQIESLKPSKAVRMKISHQKKHNIFDKNSHEIKEPKKLGYFYEGTFSPQENETNWSGAFERQKRSNELIKPKTVSSFEDSFGSDAVVWPATDISCVIILLVILLIGEASASPVDTIAKDAWFNYLDEIDYLVAYTKRGASISICTAITVFAIGCITIFYCGYASALNAYNLHIYMFGIFFGFALVITFFYPFPQEQKSFYRGLISVRYCFQSKEAFMLFTTAAISGIPHAAISEFTLWFIEDIGGTEFTTSTAIALALISDSFPQLFSKKMQKVSTRSAVVAFGMFCCALQFLLYVAIQMPWAIVAVQLLHGASHYIFWLALKQRLVRVLKAKTEHSLSLTLRGFHLLGYSVGAVVNGMLYSYSPTLLFSTMALLSLIWCLVLFFCEFCCQKRITESVLDAREEEMKLFDDMQDSEED